MPRNVDTRKKEINTAKRSHLDHKGFLNKYDFSVPSALRLTVFELNLKFRFFIQPPVDKTD